MATDGVELCGVGGVMVWVRRRTAVDSVLSAVLSAAAEGPSPAAEGSALLFEDVFARWPAHEHQLYVQVADVFVRLPCLASLPLPSSEAVAVLAPLLTREGWFKSLTPAVSTLADLNFYTIEDGRPRRFKTSVRLVNAKGVVVCGGAVGLADAFPALPGSISDLRDAALSMHASYRALLDEGADTAAAEPFLAVCRAALSREALEELDLPVDGADLAFHNVKPRGDNLQVCFQTRAAVAGQPLEIPHVDLVDGGVLFVEKPFTLRVAADKPAFAETVASARAAASTPKRWARKGSRQSGTRGTSTAGTCPKCSGPHSIRACPERMTMK